MLAICWWLLTAIRSMLKAEERQRRFRSLVEDQAVRAVKIRLAYLNRSIKEFEQEADELMAWLETRGKLPRKRKRSQSEAMITAAQVKRLLALSMRQRGPQVREIASEKQVTRNTVYRHLRSMPEWDYRNRIDEPHLLSK